MKKGEGRGGIKELGEWKRVEQKGVGRERVKIKREVREMVKEKEEGRWRMKGKG